MKGGYFPAFLGCWLSTGISSAWHPVESVLRRSVKGSATKEWAPFWPVLLLWQQAAVTQEQRFHTRWRRRGRLRNEAVPGVGSEGAAQQLYWSLWHRWFTGPQGLLQTPSWCCLEGLSAVASAVVTVVLPASIHRGAGSCFKRCSVGSCATPPLAASASSVALPQTVPQIVGQMAAWSFHASLRRRSRVSPWVTSRCRRGSLWWAAGTSRGTPQVSFPRRSQASSARPPVCLRRCMART